MAAGSSWGASGTIGVTLIGIGGGLGFPLPIVAGAVISGAYFGDKMSPLSDTTNLASSMADTDLYTHIRHMFNTTSIAFAITLLIEIGLGYKSSIGQEVVDNLLSRGGIVSMYYTTSLVLVAMMFGGLNGVYNDRS